MIIFPDFRRILGKKCRVYIKLTIIQGNNSKLKGEKLKTQAKNSRFRQNKKRGLPKIGRKKRLSYPARNEQDAKYCYIVCRKIDFRLQFVLVISQWKFLTEYRCARPLTTNASGLETRWPRPYPISCNSSPRGLTPTSFRACNHPNCSYNITTYQSHF